MEIVEVRDISRVLRHFLDVAVDHMPRNAAVGPRVIVDAFYVGWIPSGC